MFRSLHPDFQHRWEIYESVLKESLTPETVWLDIGCGKNEMVAKMGKHAKSALGTDIVNDPDRTDAPFLLSDLHSIPLPSGYATLITLRMVVEHLPRGADDLLDICTLLAPGGKLIILTTNKLSPIVLLPSVLPYRVKSWVIQKLFGVREHDIFPTHHRFNTRRLMVRGLSGMTLLQLWHVEEVPLNKPFLALLFGMWFTFVEMPGLKSLRSNLLAVYQKSLRTM